MASVHHLPFEIIEQVNHYLIYKDRYQLVQVSQTFYRVFIVLLYRSITIKTTEQFKQLVDVFEETEKSILPLGKYTQTLKILLNQLEQIELEKIQQLCPFVQSIHVDWRIWNYLGSPGLPKFTRKFLSVYGSCKLSCLTLDLYNIENADIKALLCYTPNLKNLTIMGIHQDTTISIDLLESIHASCIYLENISLDGYKAEATYNSNHILPLHSIKSFKLKCQFGADKYQDWLPYIGTKYPKLLSFYFNHSGSGKDIIESCSVQVYSQFIKNCPLLNHIGWHNIEPDYRYFQQLDQAKSQRLKRLEIYDTIAAPWLLTTCLFDSCHSILINVSHLTFGPVPRGMTSHELIESINKACPQLLHLSLREPQCNLSNPFRINNILQHCQRLTCLELDHVVLRVSFDRNEIQHHPLKRFIMRHCSSFDGVFNYMSPRCPDLEELSLFAHTQKDRRYKVQIHMPYQRFKTIQLHGLRTESYDAERLIRFFSVQDQQEKNWYFMKQYQILCDMEMAKELEKLNCLETRFLDSKLEKPPMEDTDWNDIYGAGYVDFICRSVRKLYLNKKLVTL